LETGLKLVGFSIKNYRSIRSAEKLRLGDLTVLIGPNNEGKSNILRGMVVGMLILQRGDRKLRAAPDPWARRQFGPREAVYEWERDFPVGLQAKTPNGSTILDFEFELTASEVEDFRKEVGSNLNGSLPIRVSIGPQRVVFKVNKRGPGGSALTAKEEAITKFIGSRLDLRNIPAIRTAAAAVSLVEDMVSSSLSALERSDDYRSAVETIEELQRPALDAIASTIQEMLATFLPDVKSVLIEAQDRYSALRRDIQVIVDDGTATALQNKGDGVQSLAAISLIHNVSQRGAGDAELVLAVEEPEAHLHPKAIHQLRGVLQEIAQNQQVVLTTHIPLLVNRSDVGSNIIVDKSKARKAKSLREIREVLGIRVADNLSTAELVLVVEGSDDTTSLKSLIRASSSRLSSAIDDGLLAIDDTHGTGNLSYKLTLLRDQLCTTHVFLDADDAGTKAAKKAELNGLLAPADRTFAISPGMKESELEDLYAFDFYRPLVKSRWGVDLSSKAFRDRRRKWSDRVRVEYQRAGQLWDDDTCRELKKAISHLVATEPEGALDTNYRSAFDALVEALELKLMRV
jgi:hypothetical protein